MRYAPLVLVAILAVPAVAFVDFLSKIVSDDPGIPVWTAVYTPGACGAVRKRCSSDHDCPVGCSRCWCFTTSPLKVKNGSQLCTGMPGGVAAEGDLTRGFCSCEKPGPDGKNTGECQGEKDPHRKNCPACSGAGAMGWSKVPTKTDLACGGPPDPIEGYAKGRKQYLMIGDSVAAIYWQSGVNETLVTTTNIAPYMPGINCGSSSEGVGCILEWIGSDLERWDVISFNFGWHDTYLGNDPKKIFNENIRNVSSVLMRTRAAKNKAVFWVDTNPIPMIPQCKDHSGMQDTTLIRELNEAAWSIVQPLGFKRVGLFSAAEKKCGKVETWTGNSCELADDMSGNKPCNVHPNQVGGKFYASIIVEAVKQAVAATDAGAEAEAKDSVYV